MSEQAYCKSCGRAVETDLELLRDMKDLLRSLMHNPHVAHTHIVKLIDRIEDRINAF